MESQRNRYFRIWTVLVILVFLYSHPVFPQEKAGGSDDGSYRLNSEYFKRIPGDLLQVVSSPTRWDRGDLIAFFTVLGVGGGLYFFDRDIHDWLEDHKTSTSSDLARFTANFGDGAVLGAFLATTYIAGELTQRPGWRRTALIGIESYLISGALVMAGKFVIGRARPRTGKDPSSFRPLRWDSGHYSLPSGHAASAFSVAAVLADQTDSAWVDGLAYGSSTLVALARVHEQKHWMSDVFIGSALGYAVGKMVCRLHRTSNSPSVNLQFHYGAGSQGVTLSLAF